MRQGKHGILNNGRGTNMAHLTGNFWEIIDKATLKTEEYVLYVSRVKHYYYPQMSDCYEPTWEWKNEYEIEVRKWYENKYGHKVADHCSEKIRTGKISREEARMIYWNVKNRTISFDCIEEYFKENFKNWSYV